MPASGSIIFECVDAALSKTKALDKQSFYSDLRVVFGVTPENIKDNFTKFHEALKLALGKKHFVVEAEIMHAFQNRTRNPETCIREREAFIAMSKVFTEEISEHLAKVKAQTDLIHYTTALEQKVEATQQKLVAAERLAAIGATASMVGHDIRNPLQAIMSDFFIIKQEVRSMPIGESKKTILESIKSVEDNIAYINKIILDLQDYSGTIRPNLEKTNLAELVHKMITALAVPRNINVTNAVHDGILLNTDKTCLKRVLTNLVNNAFQAMPKGGEMTISAVEKNGLVTICVIDTGEGIPKKLRSKIFTPLFTTKAKGQGLGLAVAKRLTETLNGKITFETEEGKGTKFTVTLPLD